MDLYTSRDGDIVHYEEGKKVFIRCLSEVAVDVS
jgi:hypothetical protein